MRSQRFCFCLRNLVICDHDAASMASVFCIHEINRMERRTGTSEKVNDQSVRLVCYKKANSVSNGIYRFGKIKFLWPDYLV